MGLPYKHKLPIPNAFIFREQALTTPRPGIFSVLRDRISGKWKKIEVPCNWELQGFGEYTYGRWYTIKGQHPSDETGTYRYKFDAPKSWAGQRVKIFFDGVMTDAEIMINGKPAGEMHQGASIASIMILPNYSILVKRISLK